MNKENKILDMHQFYEELIEKDYLPAKIDYQWIDKNETFMRETLYAFYMSYSRINDASLLHPFLKLYSDVILNAFCSYPEEEGYF